MEKITKELFIGYLEELYSDAKCALNYNNDYELLISIILSAQTTDKSVNNVTPALFERFKDLESLKNANLEEVEEIIKPLGLYKNKAKNIISASKSLVDHGYSTIPDDFDILIKLDGVGRKTANVFLSEYFDKDTLGVDTHIERVSKRLGIADKGDTVLLTEQKLKNFIQGYSSKKIHHMMIAFGRNKCSAKKPLCEKCKFKDCCNK